MSRLQKAFPIGTLAARTGVKIETVRYYERTGLLEAAARSSGGHRLYQDDQAARLGFIRRCRNLGFSLDDIRRLLAIVDGGVSCASVQEIALDHLGQIRQKIEDLQRMEKALAETSVRCSGGNTADCAIIEALYPSNNA
jgi:MerR family mercuric resistance operon transcriptional regulator